MRGKAGNYDDRAAFKWPAGGGGGGGGLAPVSFEFDSAVGAGGYSISSIAPAGGGYSAAIPATTATIVITFAAGLWTAAFNDPAVGSDATFQLAGTANASPIAGFGGWAFVSGSDPGVMGTGVAF